MGKSSLVKAAHAQVVAEGFVHLALVEIRREDIDTLPALLAALDGSPRRWIVFCDDLSFAASDGFRSLKSALEGGVEGHSENIVLYATSNLRHMMPRDAAENETAPPLRPGEVVDDKVSLSDRFGLWLGFHPAGQREYFEMVETYAAAYGLGLDRTQLRREADAWARTRGARSGRVAWQFVKDLAGRLGKTLG